MPEPVRWVLAALAVYRLAQLVAIDDGPGEVFLRFRRWAGLMPSAPLRAWLGPLARCPYCLGAYFALLLAPVALWPSGAGDLLLAVLGLAGAQAALQGGRDAA